MANNVTIIDGNIFNTKAQTIVNTINCVGVMGKGIALVFKLKYPALFDEYKRYCDQKLIEIGKLWLYKGEAQEPWVLNFPTKTHWKLPSTYDYIERGLQKFIETYKAKGITSIAFPLLGANNGGLDKDRVTEIMVSYLSKCDIDVEIYEYDPSASDDLYESFKTHWKAIPESQKKKIAGTQKRAETIDKAVNSNELRSMIQLINFPGIGIKTMEKCYKVVMHYKHNESLDGNLFNF